MTEQFNKTLCTERHNSLKEKNKEQDKRLDNHGERLDTLEQHKASVDVKIENLIQKIDDLIGYIKWFLLGLLGSGGSFIMWQLKEVLSS